MAVHLVLVPRAIVKGGPSGVRTIPDFGSLTDTILARGDFGAVASKLTDEKRMVVRVSVSQAEADTISKDTGGEDLGEVLSDNDEARLKDAMAVEVPPKFQELQDKKGALARRVGDFFTKDLDDSTVLAEYRAIKVDRADLSGVVAEVQSFDRPAQAEYANAVAVVLAAAEAKVP